MFRSRTASSLRRAIGLAFATTILASGLASAATPAGDVLDADFSFRDETSTGGPRGLSLR